MEDLLNALITTSPGLAGTLIVVVLFLKYITKRDDAMSSVYDNFNDTVKENTLMLGECKNTMTSLQTHIIKHKGR